MGRAAFVMSSVFAALGVLVVAVGLLVEAVLPKLGRMAFMIGTGSYDPDQYRLDLHTYYGVGLACIVVGLACATAIYLREHNRG